MRTGKLRPQGKVLDHWQLLHESDFEDTDTKLLLHFDNDVADFASGATVTNSNVTFSSTVWKYGSHSATFNGTNAILTVPYSTNWDIGAASGNATIDFWVRWGTIPVTGRAEGIVGQWNAGLDSAWLIYVYSIDGTNIQYNWCYTTDGDSTHLKYKAWTVSSTANTWYHLAFVRSAGVLDLYVDGVKHTTPAADTVVPSDTWWPGGQVLRFGYWGAQYLSGNMDEFRLVKGTAKWTANFTPPTTPYLGRTTTYPITKDRNNVLMISGEGADASTTVIDECGKTVTCNGGAQIDTAQFKFGQSSILFDGNGDYLSLADSADWYFGTQDFTIDCWVRFNTLPAAANYRMFATQFTDGNNFQWFYLSSDGVNYALQYNVYSAASYIVTSYGLYPVASISINTWYHVAVVRSGNTFTVYLNGVAGGNPHTTSVSVPDSTGTLLIGAFNSVSPTYFMDGWMDDIRISKGIARWTANFTPPLKTTALINGDTDEEYRLEVLFRNGYSGVTNYAGRPNNVSSSAYGWQFLQGASTSISALRNTSVSRFVLGSALSLADLSFVELLFYAKSGYVRTALLNRAMVISGTTVTYSDIMGASWNNTTDPVSSFIISGDQTNSLDCGTKLLLYRKVQ